MPEVDGICQRRNFVRHWSVVRRRATSKFLGANEDGQRQQRRKHATVMPFVPVFATGFKRRVLEDFANHRNG
jgi:hypothetical protein